MILGESNGLQKNVTIYDVPNITDKVCAIVPLNVKERDAAFVGDYLTSNRIAIRTGAHCAPKTMDCFGIVSCARFSFGINNTSEDVKKTIDVLDRIL